MCRGREEGHEKEKVSFLSFFVRSQNLDLAWKRIRINVGEDRIILSTEYT
jgi:hypothetical protein